MDTSNFWWQSAGDGPGPNPDPGDFIGQSLRFRGAQSLSRTGLNTATGDWTVSFWFKTATDQDSNNPVLFSGKTAGTGTENGRLAHWSNSSLRFVDADPTARWVHTSSLYRDTSAWYHCVVQRDNTNNTVRIFVNGEETPYAQQDADIGNILFTQGVFNIGVDPRDSIFFEGYMAEFYLIDGQALEPTAFGRYNTEGVWVPKLVDFPTNAQPWDYRTYTGSAAPGSWNSMTVLATGRPDGGNAGAGTSNSSVAVFSPGAVKKVFKFAAADPADTRVVNVWSSNDGVNWTVEDPIQFRDLRNGHTTPDQYAVYQFADGTGFSSPDYVLAAVVYGTNGFHLDFSDPADLGADRSGNGNDFTATGFESADQTSVLWDLMEDSPTQNWSTYNPLYIQEPTSDRRPNFINANLGMAANNNPSKTASTLSTIGITQNVYAEVHVTNGASTGQGPAGDDFPSVKIATQRDEDNNPAYEFYGNQSWSPLGTPGPNGTDAWTTGDVVRVAIDYAGRTCQIAVNNGAFVSNDISGMTEEPWTLACKNAQDATHAINYGQQPFRFDPPAGFEPLQTQNLPAAPIPNGRDHFQAITGPGQGVDNVGAGQTGGNFSQDVTTSSGGFQAGFGPANLFDGNQSNDVRPDTQSATVTWAPDGGFTYTTSVEVFIGSNDDTCTVSLNGTQVIAQSTRGWNTVSTGSGTINSLAVGPSGGGSNFTGVEWGAIRVDGNILVDFSILAAAQQTFPNGLWWIKDRVNSNQHQLVDSVRGNTVAIQSPSQSAQTTYVAPAGNSVAWCWNAGGAAVTNNDGSLESQVSANTDAGFSIVTYSGTGAPGATVGHGLSNAPDMYLIKRLDNGVGNTNIFVYHSGLDTPGSQFVMLNQNNAVQTNSAFWNDTQPTADVFSLGTNIEVNGGNLVAYCWHSIPGYSAFGSYTGNGSADGPFIYTGFRPALIIVKVTNTNGFGWYLMDTTRSPFNGFASRLEANEEYGENLPGSGDPQLDFLSNGFKLLTGNSNTTNDYVWCAWAENPFGGSNVSPANAR